MIINDVFDINIDKKNNKSRPLVTGEISMKEAKLYIFVLLSLTEYLNLSFLPYNLQVITHIAIINIILYTPILKSILLIKNISCALLVGFAVVFAGLSAKNTINIFLNKNIKLLVIASRLIFFGSLHNEILLDMTDVEGDSINNINTIPVRFGNNITWNIVYYITKINILYNTFDVIRLCNFHLGILFMLMSTPLIINLKDVKKYNYNRELILHTVKETNKPLILTLIYLCLMSIPRVSFISIPVWF
jgi:4-hydroxybenzoate polyprenyltransferase